MELKESVPSRIQQFETPTGAAGPSQYPSDQQQDHLVKEQQQSPDSSIKGDEIMDEAKAESLEPDWVIKIRENLEQAARQEDRTDARVKLCISEVPINLRDRDPMAYAPQMVFLGPLGGDMSDRHKWRALYHILKREKQDIKLYLDSIKELEEKAAACYEDPFIDNINDFVLMMVLDGCFMLELFRGAIEGFRQLGYSPNDPVFAMPGSMHSIQRDLLLLENQLPLFVLDRLYDLQCGQPAQRGTVAKLAIRFFSLNPTDFDPFSNIVFDQKRLENLDGLHCLQVFRQSLLPASPPIKRLQQGQQRIHCVTELSDFGITFKKRNTGRILDVKFSNGVLEIPRLFIHDETRTLFLNLIAFEQCHLDSSNEIGSYLFFMVNLIKSTADVALLRKSGIIEHFLGSDADVVKIFKQLCEVVVFDIHSSYLSELSEKANLYCKHRRYIWLASLRNKYFNNPWTSISVLAAAVLLVLTFIQTFYGVYGYYRPR